MDDILSQETPVPYEPKVVGRPIKPIDLDLLKSFLSVRMPIKKVCNYFNVNERTLYRNHGDLIHQHYALFDYDILAKQKELADAGDGKMLIWLGKVTQNQTERAPLVDVEDDEDEGAKFVVERPTPASGISSSESEELDE